MHTYATYISTYIYISTYNIYIYVYIIYIYITYPETLHSTQIVNWNRATKTMALCQVWV